MKNETEQNQPIKGIDWINTEDGVSEILYGLISALTITCTMSITKSDQTSVDDMLYGALCCNISWGLIDAVMYILMAKTDKFRGISILKFVRNSKDMIKSREFITDALPAVIANALQPEEIETIRMRIAQIPETKIAKNQYVKDYKSAIVIFFLVFLSAFPIVIPFIFNDDLGTALRISNFIAISMMFFCGWGLGKYAGIKPFYSGIIMCLFGTLLVLITIALGG
jgi:VIT1/CCC1 family predicted Fe2+/Mn2+ transporter